MANRSDCSRVHLSITLFNFFITCSHGGIAEPMQQICDQPFPILFGKFTSLSLYICELNQALKLL